MSRLAHAGDSSTVSPGRAARAARCTASSMSFANSMRRDAFQRRGEQLRVLAEQHDVPHLAAERWQRAARNPGPCPGRRRSAPASRACRRRPRASRRRSCPSNRSRSARRARRRPTASDAASPGNSRSACTHGFVRQPQRVAHRQRRQRVRGVVQAGDLHLGHREQLALTPCMSSDVVALPCSA